jgi:hypothetical protein
MEDLQQILVNEHIGDLRRDAAGMRAESRIRNRTGDAEVVTSRGDGARVRVGNWLIGVGTAVAGSAGDRRGEASGL